MRIAFRADASCSIGSGHVMRCLTLADKLREEGAHAFFLCKEQQGNLFNFIEGRGYPVTPLHLGGEEADSLQDDARQSTEDIANHGGVDWLIVDSYYLDATWETTLSTVADKIFVIDDLADRPHNCNVLLDQNYYDDADSRYNNLTPAGCRKLIGPSFALLRPEFKKMRANRRLRDGKIRRILIFFGGCDVGNETKKALMALQHLKRSHLEIDVVIGIQNPHRIELETLASSMKGVTTHFHVSNMAELIERADLYIGAAGTTTWERCCLGLPSLVITVAQNQVDATINLDRIGALTYIGDSHLVTPEHISTAIINCLLSGKSMKNQSTICYNLVDGDGSSRSTNSIIHYG